MQSNEFEYILPNDKIARHPVSPRRSAKLLRVTSTGELMHGSFEDLPQYLNEMNCDGLWANETKVLQARLYLRKPSGGRLEVFILEPVEGVVELALSACDESSWTCLVRGGRKWTSGTASLNLEGISLEATPINPEIGLVREESGAFKLTFKWSGVQSFGEVLETLGRTPLPPYMQRESDETDKQQYQTVFARLQGSVAAPTAGLHYDKVLLNELESTGFLLNRLTLHVGAGTFRPLSEGDISSHVMHEERCVITKSSLEKLANTKRRVATGTTTLRTLESLYWMAVVHKETGKFPKVISQWTPYKDGQDHSRLTDFENYEQAMTYLLENVLFNPIDLTWDFQTQIMIKPGYKIQSIVALVTNFHQPGSTLLCLIAACLTTPWKDVYEQALAQDYRFLSYGDGCLFELNQ